MIGNSRKYVEFGPKTSHACSVSMMIFYFPEVQGDAHYFIVQAYLKKPKPTTTKPTNKHKTTSLLFLPTFCVTVLI